MEEYTVTVKATPMTASEAMSQDIKVRNPFGKTTDRKNRGYLVHYPDGHTKWLNRDSFEETHTMSKTEWIDIPYTDIGKLKEIQEWADRGYKKMVLRLMIPKELL